MTEGEIIRLERQIEWDTRATQIRLAAKHCRWCGSPMCGHDVCQLCGESQSKPVHDCPVCDELTTQPICPICGHDILCLACGRELVDGHCPHGCCDNATTRAIIAANEKSALFPIRDDELASGNYRAEQVAEMRHPMW